MKNILILATAVILLSCSCNKSTKQAATSTSETTNTMLKTKWKLVELNGKKIASDKFFIDFFEANRFSAFAGCNNMGGEYELKEGNRIQFSKVMSTMMACADMQTEQELAAVLEKADNFSQYGNTMSLNKAKMAPLARFELVK